MKKDKLLKKLAQQAVEASIINGKINPTKVETFMNEFKKLPSNKSIFILSEFFKGVKRKLEEQTLTIESSSPLSPTQIKKIEAVFKKSHTISETKHIINSSLLGGIKVKIGDSVFDDSLGSKIQQIGEAITS